ncbi:hypothetical protein JTB14_010812 [Gonioctena quinquepunctata]|nr:hypothetical protein JTB14_010812 [Gonioctena quinquepunctata]
MTVVYHVYPTAPAELLDIASLKIRPYAKHGSSRLGEINSLLPITFAYATNTLLKQTSSCPRVPFDKIKLFL